MARKHIHPSWETPRDNPHSPEGVRELKDAIRYALVRFYTGLAERMFEWDLSDPALEDMRLMTRDDQPEKTLMQSGQGVWFSMGGQVHFLPCVTIGKLNIYGNPVEWRPVPVQGGSSDILDMVLDNDNSVLMKDSTYPVSDYELICQAVNALVDDYATINQLTLLAKHPFVIRVGSDNILDAKNYYKAVAEDAPVQFRYNDAETMNPVIEQTGVTIDTGLFDVLRQWENLLLTQLGIPGAQLTQKRAQQTVDEVSMGEDMTSLRRHEKLKYRQLACDRVNAMFGTHITVTSVIDSMLDDEKDKEGNTDEQTE